MIEITSAHMMWAIALCIFVLLCCAAAKSLTEPDRDRACGMAVATIISFAIFLVAGHLFYRFECDRRATDTAQKIELLKQATALTEANAEYELLRNNNAQQTGAQTK